MGNEDAGIAAETILLKRAYEPPAASDGVRVLVDRLWTRGISKSAADLDAWMRELGPSTALRTQFGHQPDRWEDFVTQYRGELLTSMRQVLVVMLQGVVSRTTITLVYAARDTQENEAVVLRQYLLQEHARAPSGWDAPAKLLLAMAGVERFAAPVLTEEEIAGARSGLLADGLLRTVQGGWQLTARAARHLHELPRAAARAPT